MLICPLCILPGQSGPDGTLTDLLDRADHYYYIHLDSAHAFALQALELARINGDEMLLGQAYVAVGEYHIEVSDRDSLRHYFALARDHYRKSDDPSAEMEALDAEATIAWSEGSDAHSLAISLRMIEDCRERNDDECLADALWDAGSAFYYQDRHEEATDYSRRSVALLSKSSDTLKYADRLISLGNSLRRNGEPEEAQRTYIQAREMLRGRRVPVLMAGLHLNEGVNYLEMDSLALAERVMREGLLYAEQSGSQANHALLIGNLGRIALLREDYDKAVEYLRRELAATADYEDPYYIYDFQLMIAEAFAGQQRFDSAYHYLSLGEENYYNFMQDDYDEQLSELQVSFETREKENRIALQEGQLDRQRLQLYGGGVVTLLSLAAGLVFYVLSRRLRRRNDENERLVGEKETLIGEIHHRVKNNLQVISSLLQLQSRGLDADDIQARDALRESQSRVQAMGLIHQKLYQGEEMTTIDMPEYLRELGDTLLDTYRLDQRVETFYDVADVSLDVDTAIPLGLIINELVTNSLKYAFPGGREGTIEIALHREEERLILEVSDDGVGQAGAPVLPSGTSFGTNLVALLSKKLRGTVDRLDGKGYGTRIVFQPTAAA